MRTMGRFDELIEGAKVAVARAEKAVLGARNCDEVRDKGEELKAATDELIRAQNAARSEKWDNERASNLVVAGASSLMGTEALSAAADLVVGMDTGAAVVGVQSVERAATAYGWGQVNIMQIFFVYVS